MLRSTKNLLGHAVLARDGKIGKIHDFFLETATWTSRYLVVDLGASGFGRKVLIAVTALERWEWEQEQLYLNLTRSQIEQGPDLEISQPVSRRYEIRAAEYFGWPAYWPASSIAPVPPQAPPVHPNLPLPSAEEELQALQPQEAGSFLQSLKNLFGFHLEAADGHLGRVEDLLVTVADWQGRFLSAETRRILPGRHLLIPLAHLEEVDWEAGRLQLDLEKDLIRTAPDYDPANPLTNQKVNEIYAHFGTPLRDRLQISAAENL